jgi:hypothetical protein
MIKLTHASRERIAALFQEEDVREAERLLEESTDNPRLANDVRRQGCDRLLFAAIRWSDGSLDRLREAIALLRKDWRDLLMASGFADDVHQHETWEPRRLNAETVARWMAGELPEGVQFGLNAAVEIRFGVQRGARGAVISLVGLEPEPRYVVEMSSGVDAEVSQWSLQEAG